MREVEEAVRERAELEAATASADGDRGRRPAAAPGAIGRAPGCSSSRSCSPSILDTRVTVTDAAAGGARSSIDFADLEDLERIYRLVVVSSGRRRA